MPLLDITQVHVKDTSAWVAEISRLEKTSVLHPVRRFDCLEGDPELIRFVVYFAINAQRRLQAGDTFGDFASRLVDEAKKAVPGMTSKGIEEAVGLLRKHWEHGKEVDGWKR